MRYGSVLLLDKYLSSFIGQASREGLLSPGSNKHLEKQFRKSSTVREDCLALVVLFDHVLVPDYGGNFHIPIMEDAGLLRTLVPESVKRDTSPAATRSEGYRRRAEMLEQCAALRPLVLNWIGKKRATPFEREFMRPMGISRKELYDGMLAHALAFYRRDRKGLRASPLRDWMTSEAIALVDQELSNPSTPETADEGIPHFEYMFLLLALSTTLVRDYQTMSHDHEAVAASHELTGFCRHAGKEQIAPEEAARRFRLVYCAIEEEGLYLPKLGGIRDALSLRRDSSWSAFRTQLLLFIEHFAKGDRDAVAGLREEIRRASRALTRVGRLDRAIKWTTYASLPVGIAESLVLGAPIAGTAMSLFSAAGTAAADILQRRYDWVLFGSHVRGRR